MRGKDFAEFVGSFGELFEQEGFKKRRLAFYKENNWFWLVVDWQLSRDKIPDVTKFALNIGVFSIELASLVDGDLSRPRDVWDCHLRERIGHLLPNGTDRWFFLGDNNRAPLREELVVLLKTLVFPYFEKFTTRDSLLEIWLSGRSPGQTDYVRREYIEQLKKIIP